MSDTKKPVAHLRWSVDVECPKCREVFNIAEKDYDSIVSNAIFSNDWNKLKGLEVTCGWGHSFEIEEVDY